MQVAADGPLSDKASMEAAAFRYLRGAQISGTDFDGQIHWNTTDVRDLLHRYNPSREWVDLVTHLLYEIAVPEGVRRSYREPCASRALARDRKPVVRIRSVELDGQTVHVAGSVGRIADDSTPWVKTHLLAVDGEVLDTRVPTAIPGDSDRMNFATSLELQPAAQAILVEIERPESFLPELPPACRFELPRDWRVPDEPDSSPPHT
jgi:hypothetical protein